MDTDDRCALYIPEQAMVPIPVTTIHHGTRSVNPPVRAANAIAIAGIQPHPRRVARAGVLLIPYFDCDAGSRSLALGIRKDLETGILRGFRRSESVNDAAMNAVLRQAWAGDAQAFVEVYRRYQPVVVSTVRRVLNYDIQDTAQEVWHTVFRYFRRSGRLPERTEHFERYLRQVSYWCAYTEYRRRRRLAVEHAASGVELDGIPFVEDSSPGSRLEAWRRLLTAYRRLSDRERECVRLSRRDGRGPTARRMGIDPKTVRNHLASAYAKLLRELLG
jgi:RNA polymerase sigma factor (sigma-70 family)